MLIAHDIGTETARLDYRPRSETRPPSPGYAGTAGVRVYRASGRAASAASRQIPYGRGPCRV